MVSSANPTDGPGICAITTSAGVFTSEERDALMVMWQEHLSLGVERSGYEFVVERDGADVLGYACFGHRDLSRGVFDLYYIAVDPEARRTGVGRRLVRTAERAARDAGGRMLIAETSGTAAYSATRRFYASVGFHLEATIKDFYGKGDDLAIFVKRF
jgi:ribosomal protein S18 acetylase RimI-like enzyme